jgi:hypothetical protein
MGYSLNGTSAAPVDAPRLDISFIPSYENLAATPRSVAPKLESRILVQTVNTLRDTTAIGQLPPYPAITVTPENIAVEQTRGGVNNMKGLSQLPVEAEKTLAVVKDA